MNVTGIADPTRDHIHKGKIGENGDVVVDLLKVSKHSDTPQGMIMRGNVTDSTSAGPIAGQTLAELQTAMTNGETYVNVHTQDHSDGEIRGKKPKDLTQQNSSMTDSHQWSHIEEEENAHFLFCWP